MILDKIIEVKKQELSTRKQTNPERTLDQCIDQQSLRYKKNIFKTAIQRENNKPIKIIAEIKKASPSKGIIRKNFNYEEIAQVYVEKKVNAVSILTDEQFFHGSLDYIRELSKTLTIPILRKDFTIDAYHIKEALIAGARAVLLIASVLSEKQLNDFIQLCDSFQMGYIVEVHDDADLEKVLALDHVDVIGINNRDLRTFSVDLQTTERLLEKIPRGIISVSESGIQTARDVVYLNSLNVDALLIGESLMQADDIGKQFDEIFGVLGYGTC